MGIDLQLTAFPDDDMDERWSAHLHDSQRMIATIMPLPHKGFEACGERGCNGSILHYYFRDHQDPSQLVGLAICDGPTCTVALVILTNDAEAPQ